MALKIGIKKMKVKSHYIICESKKYYKHKYNQ